MPLNLEPVVHQGPQGRQEIGLALALCQLTLGQVFPISGQLKVGQVTSEQPCEEGLG